MENQPNNQGDRPKKLWCFRWYMIVIYVILFFAVLGTIIPEEPSNPPDVNNSSPSDQVAQNSTEPNEYAKSKRSKEIEITEEEITDEYAISIMKESLLNNAIDVETIEVADGRPNGGEKSLILGYTSKDATDIVVLTEEKTSVVEAFAMVVDEGWDIDSLSVVTGNSAGKATSIWMCDKDSTLNYRNKEIEFGDFFYQCSMNSIIPE